MKYTGAHADEIFIGNFPARDGIGEHLISLKTVRLGDQALDIDGHPMPCHRPMFVNRSEVDAYHRIMMNITFPNQKAW